ncbi:MAG TPA: hypothetical protein VGQ41_22475 [Pyrinomonadaceae bacterium]|jgi:hypothetical protein|nr:hypothetical protein [Pyrinomonadaceae bacterium]
MKIVRVIVGIVIGVGYGVLVGEITLQLLQLTYDPKYPGPMIPDKAGWARLTAFFVAVVTSFCGALAGVFVGLARANAGRGAVIGASFGLGLFLALTLWNLLDYGSWLMREPAHVWPILLRDIGSQFVVLTLGLPLVGLITGFITSRLKL